MGVYLTWKAAVAEAIEFSKQHSIKVSVVKRDSHWIAGVPRRK
jgi:LDH2 family malate/lactate/ureidoglycolate dehydrogenase